MSWSTAVKSTVVVHNYGACPEYWAQNLPDSEREDGASDIEGLQDTMDQINRLLSATGKGTIANVDPTLVIKDEPGNNPGTLRKGSENAIYSKGGATYLELTGESVKTAITLTDKLVQYCLDTSGVVKGDPEKMSGNAQSAAAMKMLYLPMLQQCDTLRTQYGELLKTVVLGMLRASRQIINSAPGPVLVTEHGLRVQQQPTVVLPPRFDTVEIVDPATGESRQEERKRDRKPGVSDYLSFSWPPYFQPTATDVSQSVEAATKAKGQTISQRTAVKYTAALFGVTDVASEQAEIDVERERNAMLVGGGPGFDDEDDSSSDQGAEE
jgi:hypothetical protein